jgi:hypothetical protein
MGDGRVRPTKPFTAHDNCWEPIRACPSPLPNLPGGVDRRCSTTATTDAASPQWSGTLGSYQSQPFPKSMGPTGYGRGGYSGRETTGGELTIPTWPGRLHTLELPVPVH